MPQQSSAKNLAEQHLALAPEFQSPAVARCCKAWNRAFRSNTDAGHGPVFVLLRANEAYRNAMPPLSSPRNLCDFVACVAHGLTVRAICRDHASSLLDAARVASRAFKLVENASGKPAPHRAQGENKISGCETVDWDFSALETTACPELPSSNQPQNDPKSA